MSQSRARRATMRRHTILLGGLGLLAFCIAMAEATPAAGSAGKATSFRSPEQAVTALIAAARTDNPTALRRLFGPAGQALVSSGDPVADRAARARLIARYTAGNHILRATPFSATLLLGADDWPFPIPVVAQGATWHFDAQAGAREILGRRIGRNELNAIMVCRGYVQAQNEYAADAHAAGGKPDFAQKLVSTPGQHDGLFWEASAGTPESPLGPQMAAARAEGYTPTTDQANGPPAPYHGYFYKILTRQGAAAPGGARDYVAGGHMTDGFALLAFPATYGDSGVTSFMVNQDGIVFQKDLGPQTATVARAVTDFSPDKNWNTVR